MMQFGGMIQVNATREDGQELMNYLQNIPVEFLFRVPYMPYPARLIHSILRTTSLYHPHHHHPRKSYTMHFKARWPQNKHVEGPLHLLPCGVLKHPREIARKSMPGQAQPDRTHILHLLMM